MKIAYYLLLISVLLGCKKDDDTPETEQGPALYFPPVDSDDWATVSTEELGWNSDEIANLFDFLEANNTRAFIVLQDGKIAIEAYFGNTILGNATFGVNSQWYWASAGKTLTATLVGIAQEEGQLHIDQPTSEFLGPGWTSLDDDKEDLITIRHQLSMTTGLDYNVSDLDCTLPSCLEYKTDAGEQWYYHNAPYTLLEQVVEIATGTDYNTYTDQKVESAIGMNGNWIMLDYNNVYWSSARDMARFGLLALNKGTWDDTTVLSDSEYFEEMTNTSQDLNLSYGYLWWLNGKSSSMVPGLPFTLNTPLSEHAPSDLFAGMGKNGQYVEVIPNKNMVVVRMGEAPDGSLVPLLFHDEMWEKINLIFGE